MTCNVLLPDDKLNNIDNRRDEEIKCKKDTLIKEANERYNVNPEFGSRYHFLNDKKNPISRTAESAQVAIPRKVDPKKRAKKHLDGLFHLLTPGTFVESIASSSNIMEPGRPAIRVKDNDLSEFGTKNERSALFAMHTSRKPDHSTKKTDRREIDNSRHRFKKNGITVIFFAKQENNATSGGQKTTKLLVMQRTLQLRIPKNRRPKCTKLNCLFQPRKILM